MELLFPLRPSWRRLRALIITGALAIGAWFYFSPTTSTDLPTTIDDITDTPMLLPRDYLLCITKADYTHYGSYFDDEQDVQIIAAQAMGVEPGASLTSGKYVMLRNTTKYYLHDVSYPYLTPLAADLLARIAEMYQAELGDPSSRLRVTSCLRTPESVRSLKKHNGNAVENSCHLYGTTFDISYSRMEPYEKKALAKVLSILRESGYCYVKHERKQPCFHITVRK